jgi:putative ubiquitin-RnfH superfamily antitoxin RatB of RatAB toxin-antitoxin module
MLDIEVAYAKAEEQIIVALAVDDDATVEAAIHASGLLDRFPEIGQKPLNVGIFGSVCKLEKRLHQGDRVEIYRRLLHDPKDARRQRAAKK